MSDDDQMWVPSPIPEFQKFDKIPRLRTCTLVVTEKLDGTNGQVYVPEDPRDKVLVASRNRWIIPGKITDNYSFAEWVEANAEALRRLGPGRHYGEWWGAGIARGYGLTERRWSLFDSSRWTGKLPEGLPSNVHVVPVLGVRQLWNAELGTARIIDEAILQLQLKGSVAAPGYRNPEGIVVRAGYHGQLYKFTLDGDALTAPKTPSPEES